MRYHGKYRIYILSHPDSRWTTDQSQERTPYESYVADKAARPSVTALRARRGFNDPWKPVESPLILDTRETYAKKKSVVVQLVRPLIIVNNHERNSPIQTTRRYYCTYVSSNKTEFALYELSSRASSSQLIVTWWLICRRKRDISGINYRFHVEATCTFIYYINLFVFRRVFHLY